MWLSIEGLCDLFSNQDTCMNATACQMDYIIIQRVLTISKQSLSLPQGCSEMLLHLCRCVLSRMSVSRLQQLWNQSILAIVCSNGCKTITNRICHVTVCNAATHTSIASRKKTASPVGWQPCLHIDPGSIRRSHIK